MNTLDDNIGRPDNVISTPELGRYAKMYASWGSFISIVSFIGMGIMILAGVMLLTLNQRLFGTTPAYDVVPTTVMGLIYIIFAAVFLIPAIRFFRSCGAARNAAQLNSIEEAQEAVRQLAKAVKFYGIFLAVYLGVAVFVMLAGMVFGIIA